MQYTINRFQRENVTLLVETNIDYSNYTLVLTVKDTDDETNDNLQAIIKKSALLTTTLTNGIAFINNTIHLSFDLIDKSNEDNPSLTGEIDFGEYNYQVEVVKNGISKVLFYGLLNIKENINKE